MSFDFGHANIVLMSPSERDLVPITWELVLHFPVFSSARAVALPVCCQATRAILWFNFLGFDRETRSVRCLNFGIRVSG